MRSHVLFQPAKKIYAMQNRYNISFTPVDFSYIISIIDSFILKSKKKKAVKEAIMRKISAFDLCIIALFTALAQQLTPVFRKFAVKSQLSKY